MQEHRRRPPRQTAPVTWPGVPALLGAALLATLAGCGDGGDACGPDRRERLDPGSSVHLLPGAPEPDYLVDPPTSGPHRVGPVPTGVQPAPLDRPAQVQVLEAGSVLVQHEGLAEDDRQRLEALADEGVVVAPGDGLPAPVVATAWGAKQTCDTVDEGELEEFAANHLGGGPGHG